MRQVAKTAGWRLPLVALVINISLIGVIVFSFFPSVFATQANQPIVPVVPKLPLRNGNVKVVQGVPVKITFPQLSLSVDVVDGTYNPHDQSWTLNGDKAQYATITVPANNFSGNTFIYGHSNKQVFSKLLQLNQIGAEAIVTTRNGLNFYYRLRTIKDVKPSDVSLFAYRGKPILTVQTCSGSWYQNRHLLSFDFVKVSKA